jgi:hypothetical protein
MSLNQDWNLRSHKEKEVVTMTANCFKKKKKKWHNKHGTGRKMKVEAEMKIVSEQRNEEIILLLDIVILS